MTSPFASNSCWGSPLQMSQLKSLWIWVWETKEQRCVRVMGWSLLIKTSNPTHETKYYCYCWTFNKLCCAYYVLNYIFWCAAKTYIKSLNNRTRLAHDIWSIFGGTIASFLDTFQLTAPTCWDIWIWYLWRLTKRWWINRLLALIRQDAA